MALLVNIVIGFFRFFIAVVRALAPIAAAIGVYMFISGLMAPVVMGAFRSDLAVLMVAGVLALIAGSALAGILWRR